jgi:plastocyanin
MRYPLFDHHLTNALRGATRKAPTVRRGETVQIVNDDADLRHHAYADSQRFTFDSGDQEPGSKTDVTFPMSGTFCALCGVHPKMKLTVYVN